MIKHFSATKLKTYSSCGKKFYYKYIEGLEDPQSSHAILGESVHYGIAEGMRGNDPVLAFQMRWRDKHLERQDIRPDQRLFERGLRMVDEFPYFSFGTPISIEQEYGILFPYDEPKYNLIVIFDQMYPWGVLDLKTNQRKPQQILLDNDLQFILYAFAFERINGYPPERMIWYHLETQESIEARVQGKEELLFEALDALSKAVAENHFSRRLSLECSWCSFQSVCLGSREITYGANESVT